MSTPQFITQFTPGTHPVPEERPSSDVLISHFAKALKRGRKQGRKIEHYFPETYDPQKDNYILPQGKSTLAPFNFVGLENLNAKKIEQGTKMKRVLPTANHPNEKQRQLQKRWNEK